MKQLILGICRSLGYRVLHEPVYQQLLARLNALEQTAAASTRAVVAPVEPAAPAPPAAPEVPPDQWTGANLYLTEQQFQVLIPLLAQQPNELLKIPLVRDYLATQRYRHLTQSRSVEYAPYDDKDILGNTVPYNKGALEHFVSLDRIRLTLNVVASINELRNAHERKILLIGPRSEAEIYSAIAAGFLPQNIVALDLFSYSPVVTPGDMHAMPFADNSFDVVFITCVMSYTKNAPKVVSEVRRVLHDGGYVAFAEPMHYDFLPEEHKTDVPKAYDKAIDLEPPTAWWGSVDDVLKLFGDMVASVQFRSDAAPPYDGWGLMLSTVFKIKK